MGWRWGELYQEGWGELHKGGGGEVSLHQGGKILRSIHSCTDCRTGVFRGHTFFLMTNATYFAG